MNPFDALLKFCENFSFKKFFALILIVLTGIVLFTAFEFYTFHFKGSRINQESIVLERLVSIRLKGELTEDEEIARQKLLKEIGKEYNISVSFPKGITTSVFVEKFLWGMSPWIIIGLLFVISTKGNWSTLGGSVISSLFFGLVASFIPGSSLLLKALVIPWSLVLFFAISLLVIGLTAAGQTKKKNPKNES